MATSFGFSRFRAEFSGGPPLQYSRAVQGPREEWGGIVRVPSRDTTPPRVPYPGCIESAVTGEAGWQIVAVGIRSSCMHDLSDGNPSSERQAIVRAELRGLLLVLTKKVHGYMLSQIRKSSSCNCAQQSSHKSTCASGPRDPVQPCSCHLAHIPGNPTAGFPHMWAWRGGGDSTGKQGRERTGDWQSSSGANKSRSCRTSQGYTRWRTPLKAGMRIQGRRASESTESELNVLLRALATAIVTVTVTITHSAGANRGFRR